MRYQIGIIGLTAALLTGGADGMNEQGDDNLKRTNSLHTKSLNPLKSQASSPANNVRSAKSLSLKRLSFCNNLPETAPPAEMPDGDATVTLSVVQALDVPVDESLAQSVSLSGGDPSSTEKPPLDKSQERKLKVIAAPSPTLTKARTNPTIARLNLADIRTSPPRESVYSARRLSSPKLDQNFLKSEAEKESSKVVSAEVGEVTTVAAPAVAPLSQEVTTPVMTPDDGTASDDSSSS